MTEKTKLWLDNVASGRLSMSQRKTDGLIKLEGSLEDVISEAKRKGVHLVRLTDDYGNDLVAASQHPFIVLC